MRGKPDILLVLVVLVVTGVILSNLVIAKSSQHYNNKSLMGLQATVIQSASPQIRP